MPSTKIELPPDLYARAEATAKKRGVSLNDFVAESVANHAEPDPATRARRLAASLELSHLHEENLLILERIEEAFGPKSTDKRPSQAKQEAAA